MKETVKILSDQFFFFFLKIFILFLLAGRPQTWPQGNQPVTNPPNMPMGNMPWEIKTEQQILAEQQLRLEEERKQEELRKLQEQEEAVKKQRELEEKRREMEKEEELKKLELKRLEEEKIRVCTFSLNFFILSLIFIFFKKFNYTFFFFFKRRN